MNQRTIALASLLTLSCANGEDEANSRTSSAGLSVGGTIPGSSSSTSEETGTGTTAGTAATTTGGSTTGGSTTGGSTTDGPLTTTGEESTTADSDTGVPLDCWDKSPVTWQVTQLNTEALVGADPSQVTISSDGLTLYYIAGPEENRRPYRTVRDSQDEPFDGGTIEAVWEDVVDAVGYPHVLPDRGEMLILLGAGLGISVHDGAVWPPPTALGAPVSSDKVEGHFSLTADGTRLLVQRQDGPNNDQVGETWRFHEFKRAADASPGANFSTFGIVDLPGLTDDDYPHVNLCPTISPDGLHLFFGSTYPKIIDENNLGDALDVFYTSRKSLDGQWETPVAISSFHAPGLETCPSAVSEDGCTLIFHRFELGVGGHSLYTAARSPD